MAEPQQQAPAEQFQYIQLPDGSYGKFSAGASDEDIRGHIQKDFPDAFKPPPTMAQNIQKSFDVNTQTNPNEPLLETGLKSVVHGAGFPLMHPKQFAMGVGRQLVDAASMNPMATAAEMAGPIATDVREGGVPYAATKAGGEAFGGMAATAPLFAAPGAIEGAGNMARGLRSAAIGNPDAAALRGLQVGPKSPDALSTLRNVQGARPYLQGVQNLEELQSRVPQAKSEIWGPYQKAVEGISDRPVKGPDGMTTVGELEKERLQLSAINRELKNRTPNPEILKLAEQKGLNQASALAREKAVQQALDPQLESVGVNPRLIRRTFGNVAQIGQQMSGKSTLIEKPQPSGFGRMANISLKQPLKGPAEIGAGMRDIAAGRPLWSAKPTDLGIREAFRTGGPKHNLGEYQAPRFRGLLPEATETAIPLHGGGEVPGTLSEPVRLTEFGRTGPKGLPAPRLDLPLSSYHDIFPNQLPGTATGMTNFVPSEAEGMGQAQYMGQISGERGGMAHPKGTLKTRNPRIIEGAK